MPPTTTTAKLTLSYPLYASDFDPQNCNFLLVGGGGGEGRTGVGNKITLINASRKQSISEVVDIDLSRDEDSVTSLAVASSSPTSVIAFAGINSSQKDQDSGKNEHFRSFRLEYPPRRDTKEKDGNNAQEYRGQTSPLGRASLFTPSTASGKETYQRITRLSRPCKINGGQLGAIATGLAPEGEIVLFDAKTNGPMGPWVEARLSLGKGEAADIDIANLDDAEDAAPGSFAIAYCSDYVVHAFRRTLKQSSPPEAQDAYSEPHPDVFSRSEARPKFRSLRFITSSLLIVLQNKPNRLGADLLLLELSPHLQGTIISRKSLHSGISSATALSVTHLPSSRPSQPSQHIIAVAGQDTSITIFTLEHPSDPPFRSLKLRLYTRLRSVHPQQITSLSFSTHVPLPESQQSTPPQYIKLASTSIAHTVVVHTLPLLTYPPPSTKSPRQRYVLASPGRSELAQLTLSGIVMALVIAVGAFLLQAFVEVRGGSPHYLGAKDWLPQRVHDYIAVPYVLGNNTDSSASSSILPSDPSASAATALSSFTDQALSSSSSIIDQITDASASASTDISSFIEQAASSAPGSTDHATSTLSKIKDAVADSPEEAKKAVSAALEAASSAASELRDASAAYGSTASSTLSSATSSLSSTASSTTSHRYNHIRDLLSRHHLHRRHETPSPEYPIPHMIIHHDDDTGNLKAGFHDGSSEGAGGKQAKRFEELGKEEREAWMERLRDAGVWARGEGEAVLKGVFFGGVAQAVGAAVR